MLDPRVGKRRERCRRTPFLRSLNCSLDAVSHMGWTSEPQQAECLYHQLRFPADNEIRKLSIATACRLCFLSLDISPSLCSTPPTSLPPNRQPVVAVTRKRNAPFPLISSSASTKGTSRRSKRKSGRTGQEERLAHSPEGAAKVQ